MTEFRLLPLSVPDTFPNTGCLVGNISRLRPWTALEINDIHNLLLRLSTRYEKMFSALEDPMSALVSTELRKPPLVNKSATESRILDEISLDLRPILGTGRKLPEALRVLALRSGAGHYDFRNCEVMSESHGRRVLYPLSSSIASVVDLISKNASVLIERDPVLGGLFLMVAVWTIHPFQDGNGRIGRMLFNAVLQNYGVSRCYIPLYELSLFSNAGALLATRRLQRQNDWNYFISYLVRATSLCCFLQERAVPRVTR